MSDSTKSRTVASADVYALACEAHEFRRRAELQCFAAALLMAVGRKIGGAWHVNEARRYLQLAAHRDGGGDG